MLLSHVRQVEKSNSVMLVVVGHEGDSSIVERRLSTQKVLIERPHRWKVACAEDDVREFVRANGLAINGVKIYLCIDCLWRIRCSLRFYLLWRFLYCCYLGRCWRRRRCRSFELTKSLSHPNV